MKLAGGNLYNWMSDAYVADTETVRGGSIYTSSSGTLAILYSTILYNNSALRGVGYLQMEF